MDEIGEYLLYLMFDIFLFIGAIVVTLTLYRNVNKANYQVAYDTNRNTTISEQDYTTADDYNNAHDYKGYNLTSTIVLYDGDITGDCVLTDILEADEDIVIFIGMEKLNDVLNLKDCRENSISPLLAKIDVTASYQRHIEKDNDGKVTAIKYIKY